MKTLSHIALFISLVAFGCSDLLVNESQSNKNIEDFETAFNLTKNIYPFINFKEIDMDSLYFKYRKQAEDAKGDEIYQVLYNFFAEFKDGHIKIKLEGGYSIPTFIWPRKKDSKTFNPLVVRNYFQTELKLAGNENIAYEILQDKIGYIHLSTFNGGNWVHDFDKVLEYLSGTTGLIIDVRNNTGGTASSAEYIISYFIDEQVDYSFYYVSKPELKRTIYPNKSQIYEHQIVILVNGASFSTAELFPELLRQLPNVTIVGDTTGGGGGSPDDFNLPSGKKIELPEKYIIRLDEKMVEWNGIIPDIVIEQSEEDMANKKDKQLEYSVNYFQN